MMDYSSDVSVSDDDLDYESETGADVDITLNIDYGRIRRNIGIVDIIECNRMYKTQHVLFLEGIIAVEPKFENILITVKTPDSCYTIPFTRNDLVHATLNDFTNGKKSSSVAFGYNYLHDVDCLDDMLNPMLARARLINGIITLDRIRIIVDEY